MQKGPSSYFCNQLSQVVPPRQMLFMSQATWHMFLDKLHPNEPMFYHCLKQMQNVWCKMYYNQSPTLYESIDGHLVVTHGKTITHHFGNKRWCHNTNYTIFLGKPSPQLWCHKWRYPSSKQISRGIECFASMTKCKQV